MCMLNIAGMYRPTPEDVANNSTAQPHNQATIRPVGQGSPRRRNRTTPARYTAANTMAAVPKDQVETPVEQHPGHGSAVPPGRSRSRPPSPTGCRPAGVAAGCGPARRRCRTSGRRPPPRSAPAGSAGHARPGRRAARRHRADAAATRARRARRARRPWPPRASRSGVTRSSSRIRTSALTTPETAIATKHHNAMAENRRAARSACSPPRMACASSASRPPAHTAPATRWMNRLLVPRSCDPPADEWPVSASGRSVTRAPANSSGVQDQRSTGMLTPSRSRRAAPSSATHPRRRPGWPPTRSPGVEPTGQRLAGDVGDGQRHQQRRTHRPHTRGDGAQSQRAVARGVEHAVALRGHQERGDQEGPTATTAAISPAARTNGSP